MKYLLSALIPFMLVVPLLSQDSPCDSLRSQELRYFEIRDEASETWLYENFYALDGCGIDSVDVELLMGGSLLPDLVSKLYQDKHPSQTLTMNEIIVSYSAFSKQKEFQEIKVKLAKVLVILKPKVTLENWPSTKAALEELDVFRNLRQRAEGRLTYAIDNDLTYKQFFKVLDKSEIVLETPAGKKPWTYQNIDISEALALSKSAKKPLILFFTCHACVNALKMEDYLLNNHKIRPELDQHFIFVALYVDDKTPTEEATYRSLGKKNLALQKEKFQTDRQPFFVLIDVEGNILGTHGYTNKVDVFRAFLKTIK